MTTPVPPESASGFTVEKLLDGQVVSFNVVSSTRATVDGFFDEVIRLQVGKSFSSVSYFVFDFSTSFAAFNTPYAKARMTELNSAMENYAAYSAIILPPSFLTQIAQFFIRFLPQKNSITRVFSDRQSGIDWLGQMIAENDMDQRKIM